VLRELAGQRESTIVEGPMVQDHGHMLIWMPPKYAVSTVGFEEEQIRASIKAAGAARRPRLG